MHSPVEMADLEDIERAVQLVVAFALRLEPGLSFAG
jgi:putative aminopeptidase FrvX